MRLIFENKSFMNCVKRHKKFDNWKNASAIVCVLYHQLLGSVHTDAVVILSSYPAMRFLSESSLLDSMPLLRCVPTTNWPREGLPCPFLEAPNTLMGCQAAGTLIASFGKIVASSCCSTSKCTYCLAKKFETAENHDIDRTLFDHVIPRSMTND